MSGSVSKKRRDGFYWVKISDSWQPGDSWRIAESFCSEWQIKPFEKVSVIGRRIPYPGERSRKK